MLLMLSDAGEKLSFNRGQCLKFTQNYIGILCKRIGDSLRTEFEAIYHVLGIIYLRTTAFYTYIYICSIITPVLWQWIPTG